MENWDEITSAFSCKNMENGSLLWNKTSQPHDTDVCKHCNEYTDKP